MRYLAATLLSALMAAVCAGGALADPTWKLEQPPPPPGASFSVPLGKPGDLQFLAPNYGLLAVEGNATVPPGIFFYDGTGWHQLATVCGGPGRTSRIAIASPREFWTITLPSKPRRPDQGTALCHFRDGLVVASYSTQDQSPDPFREMTAAACNGPSDCWFGGIGAEDATGERRGAFHLHWDGAALKTVYAPQGRGVTDIEAHVGGTFFETARIAKYVGENTGQLDLAEPEPVPRLLHKISGSAFANDPFTVAPTEAVPANGTELLALDGDGTQIWAGGGGAASGPAVPPTGMVPRVPVAAFLDGTQWREVTFVDPPFSSTDRFVDIASVPGTTTAWAAVERFEEAAQTGAVARVALLGRDGTTAETTVPASGPGRGSAAKIAFTGANEGWLVTAPGWVFHYTDGTVYPRNTDPALAGTITFRPNEAAEQFIPDAPPVDDSELFKPPPVELEQEAPPAQTKRLPALLRKVRSQLRGRRLIVSFTLSRRARVQLLGRRKGRTVARTKARMLKPGRHRLVLKLDRRRWPQRLSFRVKEPGAAAPGDETPSTGDTVPTGGDTVATGLRRGGG